MKERDGHQCYHCKAWVPAGTPHDCWTTTEAALTADLPEPLREAWERLRETAAEFGEQRIYASHKSVMFARRTCYFFVRPKKSALEICFFLPQPLKHPRIRRTDQASASRVVHTLHVQHRDEVEAPITDWLRAAYDANVLPPPPRAASGAKASKKKTGLEKAAPGRQAKKKSPAPQKRTRS